jgi:hypothetical protein
MGDGTSGMGVWPTAAAASALSLATRPRWSRDRCCTAANDERCAAGGPEMAAGSPAESPVNQRSSSWQSIQTVALCSLL